MNQLGTEKSGTFFLLGTCGIKDILYQFAGAPALTLKSRNYGFISIVYNLQDELDSLLFRDVSCWPIYYA